ncbi:MAG: YfiR family protein [Proteobacteria bacterium]|nr:YfiR family protein [Pseudomonadota bacterium]
MAQVKRAWCVALCLLWVVGLAVGAVAPGEYRVKAVFLFNFAQFVDWPADAFTDAAQPFVIGVLGKDPFGPELDAVVRGEKVSQRPLVVERYYNIADLHSCNILYIARSEMGHLPQILAALKGRSILTVSDADGDDQTGVMIRLVNRSNRVGLQIDVGAAKAGHLTISSKLLRPAEIVGSPEG